MAKMHVRKGDKVKVLSGKDKGRISTITKSIPQSRRVVVEKTNMVKKHMRPTQQNTQGGIIEIEAPLDASNVMLVCPKCNKPTRTTRRKNADGKRVRVCRKCGKDID